MRFHNFHHEILTQTFGSTLFTCLLVVLVLIFGIRITKANSMGTFRCRDAHTIQTFPEKSIKSKSIWLFLNSNVLFGPTFCKLLYFGTWILFFDGACLYNPKT